ncbi:MAG: tetratricopeptide repeat protein [Myxococcota bacterium]|nr:tetratricopeptide repeat protein [Myxococcota bacterium]
MVLAFAPELLLEGSATAQTKTQVPTVSTASAAPMSPATGPVAPAPSLADTLVGAAKDDYLAARSLYESGDFARALARFEAAYDTSRDARLLWNAAVCQKAMEHYAKAMSLVRRYLDSGSPLVTEATARNAQAFIAAAESRTARLDVVSSESDAMVYVDGESVGSTPLRSAIPRARCSRLRAQAFHIHRSRRRQCASPHSRRPLVSGASLLTAAMPEWGSTSSSRGLISTADRHRRLLWT